MANMDFLFNYNIFHTYLDISIRKTEQVKRILFVKNMQIWISFQSIYFFLVESFKGGYLDFSHLTPPPPTHTHTEIYMKKQCKSSLTKNHKITHKKI